MNNNLHHFSDFTMALGNFVYNGIGSVGKVLERNTLRNKKERNH